MYARVFQYLLPTEKQGRKEATTSVTAVPAWNARLPISSSEQSVY